uniref:Uncharacterized protein n=1 Tax=Arundo donax TaxID=35708 RepID=A0A0A8YXM8_ARUDO
MNTNSTVSDFCSRTTPCAYCALQISNSLMFIVFNIPI